MITIPHRKKYCVANRSHGPKTRIDFLVRSQQLTTDMTFGTWNVTIHYRSGSVTAAPRELARNKLELWDVQEVRWNKGGTVRGGDCNFF